MSETFRALLAHHYVRIHGVALGFLRDEQEARESAQDALLKAWRARDRYDPDRPFYPWLYRIVKNTCFDAIARRKHRPLPGLDVERFAHPSADASERFELARDLSRLKVALATLTKAQQEIINLRHFQDLSYAEMAQVMEVPEGTVMSRLYRARKALARAMEVS